MSVASLEREIILNPEKRVFPEFSLERLLGTVFEPTQGAKDQARLFSKKALGPKTKAIHHPWTKILNDNVSR